MSIGTLTFGSLARLNEYRTQLPNSAKQKQSKAEPISPVSSQIPTGSVDSRTDQALVWSGLRPASVKNESPQSALLGGLDTSSSSSKAASYSTSDLDFTYSLASIKGILSYRDALLAQNPDATASLGQNLSEKS